MQHDAYSVIYADLNGDKKADAIWVNDGLQVQLSGSASATSYPFSNTAFSGDTDAAITVQDVNGDGHPDIIIPRGNGFDLLLNNGSGTFKAAVPYITDDDFTVFAVADMDGDGKPDIVYVAGNQRGPGSGGAHAGMLAVTLSSTGATRYYSLVQPPGAIAIGDFNGDGKPDVVLDGEASVQTYTGAPLTYFLNTGSGQLGSPHFIGSADYSTALAVGDLNGDGIADIVASEYSQVVVIFGNKSGTLSVGQRLPIASINDDGLSIVDVNGDGHPDIFASDNEPAIALNDGTGHFGAFTFYGIAGSHARLADLNGDGHPDLVWTTGFSESPLSVTDAYQLNNGDGTFNNPQGASYYASAPGDFNSDGLLDFAQILYSPATGEPYLGIETANGDGTFRLSASTLPSTAAYNLYTADINADGKPDLVYSGTTESSSGQQQLSVGVCINKGNLTFSCGNPTVIATSDYYFTLYGVADVVGAGRPALLYTTDETSIYAATLNSDATIKTPSLLLTASFSDVNTLLVADLNGDGLPDLAFSGVEQASVYLRKSSGSYTAVPFSDAAILAIADVNGDKVPDLLIQPLNLESGNAQIVPYLGNGKGAFTAGTAFQTVYPYYYPLRATSGDINGDGLADLVYDSEGDAVQLAINSGSGKFAASQQVGTADYYALGRQNAAALSAGSNKLDLIFAGTGTTVSAYLNLKNTQPVRGAISRLVLAASSNPVPAGSSVTLSAKVTAATGTGTPQGTVSFWNDGLLLTTAPLSSGSASVTLSTAGVPAGIYNLYATYLSSNANFQSAQSNNLKMALENNNAHQTQPYINVSSGDVALGTSATIAVDVVPVAATTYPTGNVTIYARPYQITQPAALATVPLSNGRAVLSVTVPSDYRIDAYELTASYSGDGNFAASSSTNVTSTPLVNLDQSCSVSVSNVSTTGVPGSTLTASVSVSFIGIEESPLLYVDGVQASQQQPVSPDNQYQGTVPDLPAGTHQLTAQYPFGYYSSPPYGVCTSPPVPITIQ